MCIHRASNCLSKNHCKTDPPTRGAPEGLFPHILTIRFSTLAIVMGRVYSTIVLICIWLFVSQSEHLLGGLKALGDPKELTTGMGTDNLYTCGHSSTIHNSQEVEAMPVSVCRGFERQNEVCAHSGTLFSLKKKFGLSLQLSVP